MTAPDIAGLCERLRAVESMRRHGGNTTSWHRNPDGPEAADLIERLTAPIKPSADTGELRERVAATCHKLLCDELGLHPDEAADLSAGVFADTILDLIQSERGK